MTNEAGEAGRIRGKGWRRRVEGERRRKKARKAHEKHRVVRRPTSDKGLVLRTSSAVTRTLSSMLRRRVTLGAFSFFLELGFLNRLDPFQSLADFPLPIRLLLFP
jgi:hypothetical protein